MPILTRLVKEVLLLKKDDKVLEIGFGPGKLISDMAEVVTEGVVEGIDFSEDHAERRRVKLISVTFLNNKVRLQKGECSTLPYG